MYHPTPFGRWGFYYYLVIILWELHCTSYFSLLLLRFSLRLWLLTVSRCEYLWVHPGCRFLNFLNLNVYFLLQIWRIFAIVSSDNHSAHQSFVSVSPPSEILIMHILIYFMVSHKSFKISSLKFFFSYGLIILKDLTLSSHSLSSSWASFLLNSCSDFFQSNCYIFQFQDFCFGFLIVSSS